MYLSNIKIYNFWYEIIKKIFFLLNNLLGLFEGRIVIIAYEVVFSIALFVIWFCSFI